jgi:hypothetical protein
MSNPIILSHIARTGGTSLFHALKAQKPEVKAREFETVSELAAMTDRQLNSYGLISTYMGSELFRRLDSSWTKVLILRDPVARLRSSYWNLRSSKETISFASSIAKAHGFRGYLASREPAVIFQANNPQTWTVLGDRSVSYRQKYEGWDEQEIMALATERLKEYDFIGFTESLDDLWSRLCLHFGWDAVPLPRLRANSHSCDENEEPSMADLNFHTRLDSQLLQIARGIG